MSDETRPSFAEVHARRGYTIGVYLPPDAPWATVDSLLDRIANMVHSEPGEGWDGFVVGLAGDQLGIDSDLHDGIHIYMSTSCLHGDHEHCKAMVGTAGEKRPGRCKHCDAVCRCSTCGHEAPLRTPATQASEPLPPFPYHLARCMGCDLLTDDCTCIPGGEAAFQWHVLSECEDETACPIHGRQDESVTGPEDGCRVLEVDGGPIRIHGSGEFTAEDTAAMGEVVATAKKLMATLPPGPLEFECPLCGAIAGQLCRRESGIGGRAPHDERRALARAAVAGPATGSEEQQ